MTRASMSKDFDVILLLRCTSIKVDEVLKAHTKAFCGFCGYCRHHFRLQTSLLVVALGEPRLAPGPSTCTAALATGLILQFGGWVVWLHGLQISFGGRRRSLCENDLPTP